MSEKLDVVEEHERALKWIDRDPKTAALYYAGVALGLQIRVAALEEELNIMKGGMGDEPNQTPS